MCHVCLRSHADQAALFCGDTLFNAGAGNCHNGGHPVELYKTFSEQLAKLPDATRSTRATTTSRTTCASRSTASPTTRSARAMLDRLAGHDPEHALVTTLAVEREINTFFRLTSPAVIAKLREAFPDLPDKPDPRTVFLKLRELRNSW